MGQSERAVVQFGDGARGGQVGDMGDQRVEARPAFGLENGGDRPRVFRVGGQPIDGLGGQDDEAAKAQRLGGLGDRDQSASTR